jgi:hypothetical protein
MNPMSRFALFTVTLFALVAIGSQPRHGGSLSKSMKDVCVCIPTRAGLMMKSAVAKTQAQVRSTELHTLRAAVSQ